MYSYRRPHRAAGDLHGANHPACRTPIIAVHVCSEARRRLPTPRQEDADPQVGNRCARSATTTPVTCCGSGTLRSCQACRGGRVVGEGVPGPVSDLLLQGGGVPGAAWSSSMSRSASPAPMGRTNPASWRWSRPTSRTPSGTLPRWCGSTSGRCATTPPTGWGGACRWTAARSLATPTTEADVSGGAPGAGGGLPREVVDQGHGGLRTPREGSRRPRMPGLASHSTARRESPSAWSAEGRRCCSDLRLSGGRYWV
jgi:hypothetical protein